MSRADKRDAVNLQLQLVVAKEKLRLMGWEFDRLKSVIANTKAVPSEVLEAMEYAEESVMTIQNSAG